MQLGYYNKSNKVWANIKDIFSYYKYYRIEKYYKIYFVSELFYTYGD